MTANLEIDPALVPFSRSGSYIAFSRLEGEHHARSGLPDGIWLRSVHGAAAYEVMLFELAEDGRTVACRASMSASTLSLAGGQGRADICIPRPGTVRVRLEGVSLRITARSFRNHGAIPESDGSWVFSMAASFRMYRLIPLRGNLTVDAPWEVKRCKHIIAELSPSGDGCAEMAIEELSWMRPVGDHSASFDSLAAVVQAEFESFAKPLQGCPEPLRDTARKAAYLNWSSVVRPHGLIKRPAMYMSKNWMTNVWAWDHAFNALAASLTDPDLAWDQFMVIFDHQDEHGQIPDFISDVRLMTCFVKPPIHGWILKRMIEFGGAFPEERLEKAYDVLSKWTDWWFTFRNPDGDGLPVYWHGNDSGWDNGTVFDVPFPVKSPDLAAFLVVQMEVLADLADQVGRSQEAGRWRERAHATLDALVSTLWCGNRFRGLSTVTRESAAASDSVFGCLPIILGKRLPRELRGAIAAEIRRHLTEWGPATEHPDSPLYAPDGYWRGPIWAPPTMVLVDGLREAGEAELASDIASRFCALCKMSGFAENFNALTGEPLRDPAYTWTSSVFLTLANKYL